MQTALWSKFREMIRSSRYNSIYYLSSSTCSLSITPLKDTLPVTMDLQIKRREGNMFWLPIPIPYRAMPPLSVICHQLNLVSYVTTVSIYSFITVLFSLSLAIINIIYLIIYYLFFLYPVERGMGWVGHLVDWLMGEARMERSDLMALDIFWADGN